MIIHDGEHFVIETEGKRVILRTHGNGVTRFTETLTPVHAMRVATRMVLACEMLEEQAAKDFDKILQEATRVISARSEARDLLMRVIEWRNSDGNEPFPSDLRVDIESKLEETK